MLLEIQRLHAMLQSSNKKAWSTEDLTESFGWHGNEGMQQQDIFELNRILFEAIETTLRGTPYETLIDEMFFGTSTSYITCAECGNQLTVEEKFMDLPLYVEGFKGVNESLDDYFKPEDIEGVNCQCCEKPTTMAKGPLLTRLPPVLTFNLTRIKYDM